MSNISTTHGPTAEHRTRAGASLVLASSLSNQTGAALGTKAFDGIGPVGVVAIRQIFTGLILMLVIRPNLRTISAGQWVQICALGTIFGVMNLSLYLAIDRIGLGLAVTLEFLGPLAVALCAARSAASRICALVAAAGVVLLCAPGPSSDVPGILLALLAAAAWASYILLNRSLGCSLPALTGTAAASLVSGVCWIPLAIFWFSHHELPLEPVLLAVGCALLASVFPYMSDMLALRRISANLFGVLASLNPVWAAGLGWLMLGELLEFGQLAGMLAVVTASVVTAALKPEI
ncbi:EamA family transporter [Glutamicibacter sp. NPDC087344]|uniref:EamA family transporter n=1 Tax=Glutamicibacter sp. NPDC087344 TaxID=3363994 RepID=UPI00381297F7